MARDPRWDKKKAPATPLKPVPDEAIREAEERAAARIDMPVRMFGGIN